MTQKPRLGRIQYLNSLPIYFALENVFGENGFHLAPDTPAGLNARMRRGELDVSGISAMEYARWPLEYYLLPDLSISSQGPVGSVILFSRAPFSDLHGQAVAVSAASASGAALLKVLMAEVFKAEPEYQAAPLTNGVRQKYSGVLAIGDEALRLKMAGEWPYELDLGAAWQELTGLPFVFGVWAVRREFARNQPESATALHRLLLRSRDWGVQALPELSRMAARFSEMSAEQILAYFHQLDFSLGPEQEKGLKTFFQYLQNLEVLASAPELAYFAR
ncbi:MAG: menaquinone biosynthesis protein [Deltaproteobacteria bacterium]|nr:menaquinone biosynthesis protein [Deltaproteobacteria bacterium]